MQPSSGEPHFDADGFALAVNAVIKARGINDQTAAAQIGINNTTFRSILRRDRHAPSAITLARIAAWAQLPVDAFIIRACYPQPLDVAATMNHVEALRHARAVTDVTLAGMAGS